MGAVAYAAVVILFVAATRLTTAANAIFLQYTAPIYVAALSHWVLRERALKIDWLVIVIALGGIAFFFVDQISATGFWGNVCALASGVAFASMALLMRKQKDGSPLTSILLGNAVTALVCLPFMFGKIPDTRSLVALALLGTVQLGLSYVLYSIAIKHVTAMESALIPLLEPVLNPLWVMLALGERPGFHALVGGAVVLTAVLLRGVMMVANFRLTPAQASTATPD
jgi:drug/metabolite transporter (DMT)-like permease